MAIAYNDGFDDKMNCKHYHKGKCKIDNSNCLIGNYSLCIDFEEVEEC